MIQMWFYIQFYFSLNRIRKASFLSLLFSCNKKFLKMFFSLELCLMCVLTQHRSKFLEKCENLLDGMLSFIIKRKHKTKDCVLNDGSGQGKWCVSLTVHMAHLSVCFILWKISDMYRNREEKTLNRQLSCDHNRYEHTASLVSRLLPLISPPTTLLDFDADLRYCLVSPVAPFEAWLCVALWCLGHAHCWCGSKPRI